MNWPLVILVWCLFFALLIDMTFRNKRRTLLHFITRFLSYRDIRDKQGTLYMRRYCIFGFLPGDGPKPYSLYLHRFYRPDEDRHLHTHPWRYAVSLILLGGYEERRHLSDKDFETLTGNLPNTNAACYRDRKYRPGAVSILRHSDAHRVTKLLGGETWTLFFAGPKTGSWGFIVPGRGLVDWRTYLAENGMEVEY